MSVLKSFKKLKNTPDMLELRENSSYTYSKSGNIREWKMHKYLLISFAVFFFLKHW